jgi:hypothetical protein
VARESRQKFEATSRRETGNVDGMPTKLQRAGRRFLLTQLRSKPARMTLEPS